MGHKRPTLLQVPMCLLVPWEPLFVRVGRWLRVLPYRWKRYDVPEEPDSVADPIGSAIIDGAKQILNEVKK